MTLEEMQARITEIDALTVPMEDARAQWMTLDDERRKLRDKCYQIEREAERAAEYAAQAAAIWDAWCAYCDGARETVFLAGPAEVVERPVLARHAVWIVHRSCDTKQVEWTVSHGPTGLRVRDFTSEPTALGLCVTLAERAPEWRAQPGDAADVPVSIPDDDPVHEAWDDWADA